MNKYVIICLLIIVSAIAKNREAIATIEGIKGYEQVHGMIVFSQDDEITYVRVYVNGLSPGKHGIHIHEIGDISNDTAANVGNHFNPKNVSHSCTTTGHIGDMANLISFDVLSVNGVSESMSYYQYESDQIKLNGGYSVIGRSVIIHNSEDRCNGTSGDSGIKIAQGVIGISSFKNENNAAFDSESQYTLTQLKCSIITRSSTVYNTTGYLDIYPNGTVSLENLNHPDEAINGGMELHLMQFGDIITQSKDNSPVTIASTASLAGNHIFTIPGFTSLKSLVGRSICIVNATGDGSTDGVCIIGIAKNTRILDAPDDSTPLGITKDPYNRAGLIVAIVFSVVILIALIIWVYRSNKLKKASQPKFVELKQDL